MTDDFGSRYTSASSFPLSVDSTSLSSGSVQGVIGPDDTSDEDWFKVSLVKGAIYEFKLIGGKEIYALNNGVLYFYSTNGTSQIGYNDFQYYINSQSGSIIAGLTTGPITATGDYYLRVDLDGYASSNDVGLYTLEVKQVTEGFNTFLSKSSIPAMTDDFGSRYTSASYFGLGVNSSSLNFGSVQGVIGPEDTTDEDWFKISLIKGATYEFKLIGGKEIYDLNNGVLYFYSTNGTSQIGYNDFQYYINSQSGSTAAGLITGPIAATGDYYLRVDLDSYADANDVGAYRLQVEQLTRGFSAAVSTSGTTSTSFNNEDTVSSSGGDSSGSDSASSDDMGAESDDLSAGSGGSDFGDEDLDFYTFDGAVDDYKVAGNGSNGNSLRVGRSRDSFALWGNDSRNNLVGGSKDDYLVGGGDTDYLTGGRGADVFVMTDWDQRKFDFITDFSAREDVIGISMFMMPGISDDDSIEVVKYSDVRNRATAIDTFNDLDSDVYVLLGTTRQIDSVRSSGWTDKIQLAIDVNKKQITYDADGNWRTGAVTLAQFTGKFTRSWTGDNFLFDLNVPL